VQYLEGTVPQSLFRRRTKKDRRAIEDVHEDGDKLVEESWEGRGLTPVVHAIADLCEEVAFCPDI